MDITKLKDNIVNKVVEFAGEKVSLDMKPNSLTQEDGKLPVEEFVAKGLSGWDLTIDGEPLEITSDNLSTVIPDGLLTLIFDTILDLKKASMGKLKVVGR
jgi:GTP:adenosylcobinamide-phosphate guanylyltransferase